MTYNTHPDDQPPADWRRTATDEEVQAQMPEFALDNPVAVGITFCNALDDPAQFRTALHALVTPESLPYFGDFSQAAAFLAETQDVGYGSRAQFAVGDEDVAYVKIMSGVVDSYQVFGEQIVPARGIVTLVKRHDLGGEWRVHAIGDVYVRPEDVPH